MGKTIDIRYDNSEEEITEMIIGETDRLHKHSNGELYICDNNGLYFEIESPEYLLKALKKAKELGWF